MVSLSPNRQKKGKQNFLQGAMILSIAVFFVKILGIVFKTTLNPILEGEGTGYYYSSYSIINLIVILTTAGLPIALSRLVAEYMVHERYRDVKRVRNVSTMIFVITGTIGSFALLIFAKPIANIMEAPLCYPTLMAFSPAILFMCLMSAYRGYYEGMHNMVPTAISQCIEAVVKIFIALFLSVKIKEIGMQQFLDTGLVFGQSTFLGEPILDTEKAYYAILPYASAGAIFGVALSTLVGLAYLIAYSKIKGDRITKKDILYSPKPYSVNHHIGRLVKMALPICLGSLVISFTSTIDIIMLGKRFQAAVLKNPDVIYQLYGHFISENSPITDLHTKLNGYYEGSAITIFNLVPTFATAFATSILPTVTEAWISNNKRKLQKNIESVLRLTSMIVIPASFGLICIAEPLMRLLFRRISTDEVAFLTPMLSFMGISAIFVSLASLINAMLQAIGRTDIPVKFMTVGAIFKIISNYILIGIPEINIKGMPIGTLICYFIIVVAGLISLLNITDVKINFFSVFLKPTIAGAMCGLSAFLIQNFLSRYIAYSTSTIVAIAFAAIIYVIVLFLVNGITKEDVIMLPKGEKIAKRLEKLKIIR